MHDSFVNGSPAVIATFYLVGYLVLVVVSVENPLFMGKVIKSLYGAMSSCLGSSSAEWSIVSETC